MKPHIILQKNAQGSYSLSTKQMHQYSIFLFSYKPEYEWANIYSAYYICTYFRMYLISRYQKYFQVRVYIN